MAKPKEKNLIKKIENVIIPGFNIRDALQVIIGATILAVPIGFTEETWTLGSTLPLSNIIGIFLISLLFISTFTYYHYHKKPSVLKNHFNKFLNRTISTYILSFIIVAVILSLIQKAPWLSDTLLAFKRTVIITLPATMSAAVADTLN